MRFRSGVLLSSLLLVVAACAPPPTTPVAVSMANTSTARPGAIALGDYACRISEQGYAYPAFRCVARDDGGRTVVEKIEGSVRFRGVAVAARGGFELHGEVYCPWGDCTEPVRAVFRPLGGGSYVGEFPDRQSGPAMVVTLEPVRYGQGYGYGYGYGYGGEGYGGQGYGYGGFGYGGFGYGGLGYGGAAYGGHRGGGY